MAIRNPYGIKYCNPGERQITTIGTGYIANFLSGGDVSRVGSTLTNRRIYFSGTVFTLNDKGQLLQVKQQKILNVRDVTGVGYIQYNPVQYIIYGIIALLAGLGAIGFMGIDSGAGMGGILLGGLAFFVMMILYFLYRKVLLSIEYAGGNLAFNIRWFSQDECDNFIRNIHLAKDKLYSAVAIDQEFAKEEYEEEDTLVETVTPFSEENENFPDAEKSFYLCPNCGKRIAKGDNFCPHCTMKMKDMSFCIYCGEIIEDNSTQCKKCIW